MVSRHCVIGGRLWSVVKSPQSLVLPAMTVEKLILLLQAQVFFFHWGYSSMHEPKSFIYLSIKQDSRTTVVIQQEIAMYKYYTFYSHLAEIIHLWIIHLWLKLNFEVTVDSIFSLGNAFIHLFLKILLIYIKNKQKTQHHKYSVVLYWSVK